MVHRAVQMLGVAALAALFVACQGTAQQEPSPAGQGGDDLLCGGPGDDHLGGGPGDDRLNGGEGTDECVGGPGKNSYVACETQA